MYIVHINSNLRDLNNILDLEQITDLDSATTFGFYRFTNTSLNIPTSVGGTLMVLPFSTIYFTQIVFVNNSIENVSVTYVRSHGVYGFTSWTAI